MLKLILSIIVPFFVFSNHSILPTKTVEETFYWKSELLETAQKEILYFTGFGGGKALDKTLDLLEKGLSEKPDLKVKLFIDDHSVFTSESQKNRIDQLKIKFPQRFFSIIEGPSSLLIQEGGLYTTQNHCKLLIVDEKYFLVGGTNLFDNFIRSDFDEDESPDSLAKRLIVKAVNDFDIVGSGPSALQFKKDFLSVYSLYENNDSLKGSEGNYQVEFHPSFIEEEKGVSVSFETHPEVIRNVKAEGFITGPRINYHKHQKLITKLIKESKSKITIGNLYFFPVKPIFDEMLNAANRGVSFAVITNGLRSEPTLSTSTIWFYAFQSRVHYAPLFLGNAYGYFDYFEAKNAPVKNVQIFEFSKEHTLFHKKAFIADHRFCIVGSYNLGKKSENADFESSIFIDSEEVAQRLEHLLYIDRLQSQEIKSDVALSWYFNPLYDAANRFEGFFLDGIACFQSHKTPTEIKEPSDGFYLSGSDQDPM